MVAYIYGRVEILFFCHLIFYRNGKSKEHDSIDPISFDGINVVEDWISGKDVCVDDYGSIDWMSVVPPSTNTMLLGSSNDEAEDLDTGSFSSLDVEMLSKVPKLICFFDQFAGFDDHEIFNREKDGEENVEEDVVRH